MLASVQNLTGKGLSMVTRIVVVALALANLAFAATVIAKFDMKDGQAIREVQEVVAEPV